MEKNLVIVESPAKAGTIQKFLGEGYVVKPSFGHIRDLQDKKLSVDVDHNFTPEYVILRTRRKSCLSSRSWLPARDRMAGIR